jgi:hypothetical protein
MPFVPLDADELRDVSTQRLRDYIWRFDAHIATIGDPVARLSAMLVLRGPLEELARREASRRCRSTKQDMFEQRQAILGIVQAMHPMTVRQVFYQATVRGIVAKTEAGYIEAQKVVAWLRRNGYVRYDWIADSTRFNRKPTSFEGPGEAIRMYAEAYRKALWTNADSYVEVWLEKDALSGVVYPVTSECDVSLMVARGHPSITFLASAAEQIGRLDVAGLHLPSGRLRSERPGCRPGHGGLATEAGSRRGDPLQANRGHAASDRGLEPADAAHQAVRHGRRLLPWRERGAGCHRP